MAWTLLADAQKKVSVNNRINQLLIKWFSIRSLLFWNCGSFLLMKRIRTAHRQHRRFFLNKRNPDSHIHADTAPGRRMRRHRGSSPSGAPVWIRQPHHLARHLMSISKWFMPTGRYSAACRKLEGVSKLHLRPNIGAWQNGLILKMSYIGIGIRTYFLKSNVWQKGGCLSRIYPLHVL